MKIKVILSALLVMIPFSVFAGIFPIIDAEGDMYWQNRENKKHSTKHRFYNGKREILLLWRTSTVFI